MDMKMFEDKNEAKEVALITYRIFVLVVAIITVAVLIGHGIDAPLVLIGCSIGAFLALCCTSPDSIRAWYRYQKDRRAIRRGLRTLDTSELMTELKSRNDE